MRLAEIRLRARNPEALARFYRHHFAMNARRATVGYGHPTTNTWLRFVPYASPAGRGEPTDGSTDVYWKVGITLANVDAAVHALASATTPGNRPGSLTATTPAQFEDIGYLAHLRDAEDYEIELLQHHFGVPPKAPPSYQPFETAGLGQVTLRVRDIDRALGVFRDVLGMRLLSIQPVSRFGFTLYFLAYTEESPPNANLHAVENREWLWQRPYTTVELQHLQGPRADALIADAGRYDGLVIELPNPAEVVRELASLGQPAVTTLDASVVEPPVTSCEASPPGRSRRDTRPAVQLLPAVL